MAKILALVFVLVGLLGGAAAGYVLRPPPPEGEEVAEAPAHEEAGAPESVQLREPFVVPILRDGRSLSHIVLMLGIESTRVARDDIFLQEPRLRDGLNEVLYLHGSLGGFEGDFTTGPHMTRLRERLDGVVTGLLDDSDARVLLIAMTHQNG
ncbi:flagellar basal body-associated protein FliL [Jannaschia sp.]|nr:flagellar basal body-associated protein FliL [Jannaschia sp.]